MLTKCELIDEIAAVNGITKTLAEKSLNYVVEGIASAIVNYNGVKIRDFGNFEVRKRAGRIGRSPIDGSPIEVPPYQEVKFCAGKPLKERLKQRG